MHINESDQNSVIRSCTMQDFVRRKLKTVFVCNYSSTVYQPEFLRRAIYMQLNGLVKHF